MSAVMTLDAIEECFTSLLMPRLQLSTDTTSDLIACSKAALSYHASIRGPVGPCVFSGQWFVSIEPMFLCQLIKEVNGFSRRKCCCTKMVEQLIILLNYIFLFSIHVLGRSM